MQISVCLAKLHRVTVTGADLNYVGSVTIDELLLRASGLRPRQMVTINNLSNGVSWRTYIVKGKTGQGEVILNGPPARHFQKGDKAIIWAEISVSVEEADRMGDEPTVVFVNDANEITSVKNPLP